MSVMDGDEAISRLRNEGFKVPIIALTSHITKLEVEKCMPAGADEYLSKPYKPKEFYYRKSKLICLDEALEPIVEAV